jgi:hypothetical protein
VGRVVHPRHSGGRLSVSVALLRLLAVAMLVPACGRRPLPHPRIGSRPPAAGEAVEVPYPPPVARVEIVPAAPPQKAVWIDGSWTFRAGGWRWDPGGWVIPPAEAYFVPWTVERGRDGRLFFFPSAWYDAHRGGAVAPPPILVAAAHDVAETETEPSGGGSSGVEP